LILYKYKKLNQIKNALVRSNSLIAPKEHGIEKTCQQENYNFEQNSHEEKRDVIQVDENQSILYFEENVSTFSF